MKTRVEWSSQVERFVLAQAPGPRRRLRLAIRGLAEGRGDTKALVDELMGYSRLRVGQYRVIYFERVRQGQRVVECIFAERRNVIYELFTQMLLDDLA